MNYYNDNDSFACEWLMSLALAGELPKGAFDRGPIQNVRSSSVSHYTQCHFFAGIGGWPLALRLAGWPEDRPVWTGSCPCQPFSQAGKQKGIDDERHLWPEFFRLIRECRPATIFGEQVASKAGREWLSGVRADLEALGYAVGAADLCAASTGAPHIRQRLFWVAESEGARSKVSEFRGEDCGETCQGARGQRSERDGDADGMADLHADGRDSAGPSDGSIGRSESERSGSVDGLGNTGHDAQSIGARCEGRPTGEREPERGLFGIAGETDRLGHTNDSQPPEPQEQSTREEFPAATGASGHYVHCRDGKTRRVPDPESGILPLAYGFPRKLGPPLTGMGQVGIRAARANRVGRLRGYGNAIVPQLAAEFIREFMNIGRELREPKP